MSDDSDPDLECFTRLVRRHELAITRFVRFRVGREHTGDVLQDVWEAAWRTRADGEIDLVSLLSLARTRSARHHAKRRRRAWVQVDELEIVAIGAGVEEQILTREHAERVRETLQTLSRRDREALHLALVLGLRDADIARVLGLPTTNAASKATSEAKRRYRRAWTAHQA